jgi:hypothetical protein
MVNPHGELVTAYNKMRNPLHRIEAFKTSHLSRLKLLSPLRANTKPFKFETVATKPTGIPEPLAKGS